MVETLFPMLSKKPAVTVTDKMLQDLTFWEMKFQQMNFPGMDLVEATAFPLTLLEKVDRKKQYNRIKRDFIKYALYNHLNDLKNAGVDDEAIFFMKKGIMPENFNIHVKIPFDYTGEADFSNLVFMQDVPYMEDIHRFMDMQMEGMDIHTRPLKLYIPVPPGKIYIPTTMFTGSGGKGKHDRSAVAGFSEGTLKSIAQKAMPGR